ncbi:ABC transporter ATP-binding protein [Streptomyces sp. NBC_00083]|uniref:ABC transporter ATP-binding protein n=1 Tax=Streptomyces sp. NBC_00083 TaxID=2975647 RepID=UPI002252AD3B|nr:ATP-binding cassette domain-containing protein [Streptomyces sp. NBC_00083]MCX5387137.1 ATP-binding cassette domain-containing protein [Streptomyces sp. NBC_00083]
MLELSNITAGYERDKPVVRDMSLVVARGEAVGLLGPRGCGKSTLARVAALLHRPDAGTVVIGGTPVVTDPRHRVPRALRTTVGFVLPAPGRSGGPALRLRDLIAEPLKASGRRIEIRERVDELAHAVGLGGDLLTRDTREVGDGPLQRALLARALVLRPRLLICDEMTALMDSETTDALIAAVCDYRRASGASLLAVGDDPALLATWCDRTVTWNAPTTTPLAHTP